MGGNDQLEGVGTRKKSEQSHQMEEIPSETAREIRCEKKQQITNNNSNNEWKKREEGNHPTHT